MQGHPVWFEMHVADIGRAVAFYQAVAGWQFDSLKGMPAETYRMISNTPDGSLGGAIVAGFPDRRGSGTVIYIAVEDLARTIADVQAHGGSVEAKERLINDDDGAFVLVRDPDGNLLGLWTRQ